MHNIAMQLLHVHYAYCINTTYTKPMYIDGGAHSIIKYEKHVNISAVQTAIMS